MKKKILVITQSNPNGSPRPNRVLKMLLSNNNIYNVSLLSEAPFKGVDEYYKLSKNSRNVFIRFIKLFLMKMGLHRLLLDIRRSKKVRDELINKDFDVIICHDLIHLPFVFEIKKKAKVLFDAREYYTRHFEDRLLWNFLYKKYNTYLVEKYVVQCDKVFTVSKGLSNEYKKEFNINTEVFMSLPERSNTSKEFYDNNDKICLVHHGGATPSRHIEKMINIFEYLDDRFSLDLYLVPQSKKYYNFLVKEASKYKNVRIMKPVQFEKINEMLQNYDVGLYLLQPLGFNLEHALPNKIFEFIQASLAICIGPSPDMVDIVSEYNCGLIAKDFSKSEIAYALMNTTKDKIMEYKKNSYKAAKILNADVNNERLKAVLDTLY